LDLGFYLGFGGIVTFPRSEELREVAALVPDDRFLIETDSPYLAPVPYRGRQNEPAFVVEVAQTLAELRETDLSEIGRLSSENFNRLFGLD
jgi:TatD DNase family protein